MSTPTNVVKFPSGADEFNIVLDQLRELGNSGKLEGFSYVVLLKEGESFFGYDCPRKSLLAMLGAIRVVESMTLDRVVAVEDGDITDV